MNVNEIKFRCSSLGHLMVEPKSKSETLSETTKNHLVDVFVSAMYKRREEIQGKFLDKGNEREEDSITLLSRLHKNFYKKNTEQLTNDFISGTCDIFLGNNIRSATETFDTKTSWSAHTFFRAQKAELSKMYYWQGLGYMILTGAKKHTVAYCLVNGTALAIRDEKRKVGFAHGMMDDHGNPTEKFTERCKQIEINHIFDLKSFMQENPGFDFDNNVSEWCYNIPMQDRLFTFSFDRNESDIEKLYKRIRDCRRWISENLMKPESLIELHDNNFPEAVIFDKVQSEIRIGN